MRRSEAKGRFGNAEPEGHSSVREARSVPTIAPTCSEQRQDFLNRNLRLDLWRLDVIFDFKKKVSRCHKAGQLSENKQCKAEKYNFVHFSFSQDTSCQSGLAHAQS